MASAIPFTVACSLFILCSVSTPLVYAVSDDGENGIKKGENNGRRELSFNWQDPRGCLEEDSQLNVMQVIPGVGWDNLQNVEMGPVIDTSYSLCKLTQDGKYLIPDETQVSPVRESIVENNAEFIENSDSFKSVTSHSINAGVSAKVLTFGKIGGKFSVEYQRLKSSQFKENAQTVQIQLRHNFYSVKQYPDSKLHPRFKARLLEIASFIKTNDSNSADYASQMLVRDFGTHFLTRVDVGAVLVRQDNYKSSDLKNRTDRIRSVTVGGQFEATYKQLVGGGANFGYQSKSTRSKTKVVSANRTSSVTYTHGGPPYRLGMNVSEWEKNLEKNLVAIDRVGKPLHVAITHENMLPEIEDPFEVNQVKKSVFEAIKDYYVINTHTGCTDPNSANFDYHANTEASGACNTNTTNYNFGGVFQTCKSNRSDYETEVCGDLTQKNYITGDMSCPRGYESVLLLKDRVNREFDRHSCERKCKYLFFKCRNVCKDVGQAAYRTYWCAPFKNITQKSTTGYLFGGVFSESSNIRNLVTRDFNCPKSFRTLKLGLNAKVCVSEDKAVARKRSVPFGGFFSCINGNVLAEALDDGEFQTEWSQGCPEGFTEHVAAINNDCSVKYCMKAGRLLQGTELDLIQPPFFPKPPLQVGSSGQFYALGESMTSQVSEYKGKGTVASFSPIVYAIIVFLSFIFSQVYYLP